MRSKLCIPQQTCGQWRRRFHISHERANAYNALVEQYHPGSEPLKVKDDLGKGPSSIAMAEEEFHRSMMDLISTVLTEGGKIPGAHGVA